MKCLIPFFSFLLYSALASESSLAVRVYYPIDLEQIERRLHDADNQQHKTPRPLTHHVQEPVDSDVDGLALFVSHFRVSLILFVLPHDDMMQQLSRLDSFLNRAQRLLEAKAITTAANNSRLVVVTSTEQAIATIVSVADAITPEKMRLKAAFFQREQARLQPPSTTVSALRQLAKDLDIPQAEIDVTLNELGSLRAIASATQHTLERLPIDGGSKRKLVDFFQSNNDSSNDAGGLNGDQGGGGLMGDHWQAPQPSGMQGPSLFPLQQRLHGPRPLQQLPHTPHPGRVAPQQEQHHPSSNSNSRPPIEVGLQAQLGNSTSHGPFYSQHPGTGLQQFASRQQQQFPLPASTMMPTAQTTPPQYQQGNHGLTYTSYGSHMAPSTNHGMPNQHGQQQPFHRPPLQQQNSFPQQRLQQQYHQMQQQQQPHSFFSSNQAPSGWSGTTNQVGSQQTGPSGTMIGLHPMQQQHRHPQASNGNGWAAYQ